MKIILVRHAESAEDIDPNMHNALDSEIGITDNGVNQSHVLAEELLKKIRFFSNVKVFRSISRRVKDTSDVVISKINNIIFDVHDIECIRNLDWGDTNIENVKEISKQRYDVGVLYFQFPNGDYTPDFVKDIGIFVKKEVIKSSNKNKCIIIFTHGFALRVIAKHILKISDEDFRVLANPKNCDFFEINIVDGKAILKTKLPTVIL